MFLTITSMELCNFLPYNKDNSKQNKEENEYGDDTEMVRFQI